jgi:hypothetical protein
VPLKVVRLIIEVLAETLVSDDPVHAPLVEKVEGEVLVDVEALLRQVFDHEILRCFDTTRSVKELLEEPVALRVGCFGGSTNGGASSRRGQLGDFGVVCVGGNTTNETQRSADAGPLVETERVPTDGRCDENAEQDEPPLVE